MSATSSLRVLIVDDEPLARKKIRDYLKSDPEVEVVGECQDGSEALAVIKERRPDVVFLDVQMPGLDGLAVSEMLGTERPPLIIFVTAYDQYAVRAFKVHALDYLLKPFDLDRFEEAVRRAKAQVSAQEKSDLSRPVLALLDDLRAKSQYLSRLVVKTDGRVLFLKTEEIDWIEAEGNYVRIHIGSRSYLLRESLSNLESELDPAKFRRIHRSTMVHLDRIKELLPLFHGEYRVVLDTGKQLTLSRSYREKLRELYRNL